MPFGQDRRNAPDASANVGGLFPKVGKALCERGASSKNVGKWLGNVAGVVLKPKTGMANVGVVHFCLKIPMSNVGAVCF